MFYNEIISIYINILKNNFGKNIYIIIFKKYWHEYYFIIKLLYKTFFGEVISFLEIVYLLQLIFSEFIYYINIASLIKIRT